VAPLQIEHIEDWARVQRHDFQNMVVLCANCHGRKGVGYGQIDRRSLREYKASLAVISSRYGDLERRVLEHFAEQRETLRPAFDGQPHIAMDWPRGLSIAVPGTMRLLMKYLIQDGYVELVPSGQRLINIHAPSGSDVIEVESVPTGVLPAVDHYRLTALGIEFLDAWVGAQPIDGLSS
jgi:HNH endonuclease